MNVNYFKDLTMKYIVGILLLFCGSLSASVTAREINQFAYQLLWRGHTNKAVQVFERNVVLYPDIANLYDSLAEGYDSLGEYKKAVANQQKAVDLATQQKLTNIEYFQNRLAQFSSKL